MAIRDKMFYLKRYSTLYCKGVWFYSKAWVEDTPHQLPRLHPSKVLSWFWMHCPSFKDKPRKRLCPHWNRMKFRLIRPQHGCCDGEVENQGAASTDLHFHLGDLMWPCAFHLIFMFLCLRLFPGKKHTSNKTLHHTLVDLFDQVVEGWMTNYFEKSANARPGCFLEARSSLVEPLMKTVCCCKALSESRVGLWYVFVSLGKA